MPTLFTMVLCFGLSFQAFAEVRTERRAEPNIDVYAIEDDAAALKALREKWPAAGDRVSMWEMPRYSKKFFEIDSLQNWCNEDPTNRYVRFEQACLDAIQLKIEPAVWYYNLACCKSVLGQMEEAIVALEKAVAAGYNGGAHAKGDSDLKGLVDDGRFQKLCALMERNDGWAAPKKNLEVVDGIARLTEDSVYYAFNERSFGVRLVTTNACPVVYVNHHANHPNVPCDGLIQVEYPEVAKKEMRHVGAANIHFTDVLRSAREDCGVMCPTIVASDWTEKFDPLNGPSSVAARLPIADGMAHSAVRHLLWNVIGIYAAGIDYGQDGTDRFMGFYPGCIAHMGGAAESDKFVRLCVEVLRALPEGLRENAALYLPGIIRHGQKCVSCEDDFMSGKAQRPVLDFDDIDEKKVLAFAARGSSGNVFPDTPLIDGCRCDPDAVIVNDLDEEPYDRSLAARSAFHMGFVHRAANHAWKLDVAVNKLTDNATLVWKVLQGDPRKISIRELDGPENVSLEVDYHEAFDVELTRGRHVKSSRVDIGCFSVLNGIASAPAVVSVYFMPNEKRVYRSDGLLDSIDYTRPQYTNFCPRLCAKGDWVDHFIWTEDGKPAGWMRTHKDDFGRVVTNAFTREGLVIDSRDELGRPKDVHRSMQSTWMQRLDSTNLTEHAQELYLSWFGHCYDQDERSPQLTTLSGEYVYANAADCFGSPRRKTPRPFAYRPELCRRADFEGDQSGFRLPLLDQMQLGYNIYAGYKHDVVGEDFTDYLREDSAFMLKERGLVPPKVLKKMRFCPWRASSNDVWRIDTAGFENRVAPKLIELSDGVYRIRKSDVAGTDGTGDGYGYKSVRKTYSDVNVIARAEACALLDSLYRRCGAADVHRLLSDLVDDCDWETTHICEGNSIDVPKGRSLVIAAWKVTDDIFFYIGVNPESSMGTCKYSFRKFDSGTGRAATVASFNGLPSRAIGNAIVNAAIGKVEAINNSAVLLYAGLANPDKYEEGGVVALLEHAARAGCAMAAYNLGVLAENRGDGIEAARCYEAARALSVKTEKEGTAPKLVETRF